MKPDSTPPFDDAWDKALAPDQPTHLGSSGTSDAGHAVIVGAGPFWPTPTEPEIVVVACPFCGFEWEEEGVYFAAVQVGSEEAESLNAPNPCSHCGEDLNSDEARSLWMLGNVQVHAVPDWTGALNLSSDGGWVALRECVQNSSDLEIGAVHVIEAIPAPDDEWAGPPSASPVFGMLITNDGNLFEFSVEGSPTRATASCRPFPAPSDRVRDAADGLLTEIVRASSDNE